MKKLCIVLGLLFSLILVPTVMARTIDPGRIHCAQLFYVAEDTVMISPGEGLCNGSYWEILENREYAFMYLDSREGVFYLYIDDSRSEYPDVRLYDTTITPHWDEMRQGWYHGNDRCIGCVWSPAGEAVIQRFRYDGNDKYLFEEEPKEYLFHGLKPPLGWERIHTESEYPINTIGLCVRLTTDNSADAGEAMLKPYVSSHENDNSLSLKKEPVDVGRQTQKWLIFDDRGEWDILWQGDGDATFDMAIVGYQIGR